MTFPHNTHEICGFHMSDRVGLFFSLTRSENKVLVASSDLRESTTTGELKDKTDILNQQVNQSD